MIKKIIKDYFTFSKKESIAAAVILVVTAFFIALPYYFSSKKVKQPINAELSKMAFSTVLINDSIKQNEPTKNYSTNHQYTYPKKEVETYTINPFAFNPNTIDEKGWQKLGLPTKTIKTILNYRNKGGKFYKPDDIRKIWGIKKEDADILVPFVTLAATNNNNHFNNNYNKNFVKPTPQIIDVNTATANDFRQLPAVGNLAYKIVKYRDKLGGFLSINQIKETYDITDSIYNAMLPFLSLKTTTINKININTASDFELAGHPYISKDIAKAIVIYRTQHGNYKKVDDIKKIVFINQQMLQKFAMYLTVE